MMNDLQNKIGYKFKDGDLLVQALKHKSLDKKSNNEKLEFLGDRVLGIVISSMIYEHGKAKNLKEWSIAYNYLVNKGLCAKAAVYFSLDKKIMAEKQLYLHNKITLENILGDAMEAVIGAVYLDGGLESAWKLIEKFWLNELLNNNIFIQDAKSHLQEWAQNKNLGTPKYEIVAKYGTDHEPIFEISLGLGDYPLMHATGSSKQIAEKNAAREFIKKYGIE